MTTGSGSGPSNEGPKAEVTDLLVQYEGTISVIYPTSERGNDWVDDHVAVEARWGSGFVVEHRFVSDIVNGALDAGLVVQGR